MSSVIRWWPALAVGLVLMGALLAAACDDDEAAAFDLLTSDAARTEPQDQAAAPVTAATNAFAASLYAELASGEENLVFSPYSAAIALAMTRTGAAGQTAAEMDAVLHADVAGDLNAGFNTLDQALATRAGTFERPDGSTVEVELSTANALWGQQGFAFREPFLDVLAADYGAGMRLVDYVADTEGARQAINGWVSDQTRERIAQLIPAGVLTVDTRLVLTNAIYLNAPWELAFDEGDTSDGAFHLLDGSTVTVPLMQLEEDLRYASGEGYQAVELPYAGRELAMLVIVPDVGSFGDVEARLESLLQALPGQLDSVEVALRLPRFEFRTQASLKEALSALGMPTAFSDAADLSLMTDEAALFIQDVVHEAFISVDEAGTEAAAATAVVVGLTSAPAEHVELTVDRPFLFLIQDRQTGAPLFLGRVVNPT